MADKGYSVLDAIYASRFTIHEIRIKATARQERFNGEKYHPGHRRTPLIHLKSSMVGRKEFTMKSMKILKFIKRNFLAHLLTTLH